MSRGKHNSHREKKRQKEVVVLGLDVNVLAEMPPWDWPRDAGTIIAKTLTEKNASLEDRLVAADLAGQIVVIDEAMCDLLLRMTANLEEPEQLRGLAVISLGPVLEQMDTSEEDDPYDDPPITFEKFRHIRATLEKFYRDEAMPKEVRRRILEAAVRSPDDWQREAIREAWATGDTEWMLTAVFGMRYVKGFDVEILQALKSPDEDTQYEAILGAGNWGLSGASDHVLAIVRNPIAPKELLLAAIEALSQVAPKEAEEILYELRDSDDPEISEAAEEAMIFIHKEDFDEDEDDDEDNPWF